MANATPASKLATYADLFERLRDSVMLLDPQSQIILEANPACEHILGIPAEKLTGRSLSQWIDDPAPGELSKALRVAMRRYHPRQFLAKWTHADGRVLTMEVMACPLTLSNDDMVLQLILKDVTFQRAAESKIQSFIAELRIANEKLNELTVHDEMTGLYNFRYLKNQVAFEHQRALRDNSALSVIFCDIDHFKNYNDRNGHPAGDRLLQEFAEVLRKCCRVVDTVARYGGEEFLVICPSTPTKGAEVLAERIRAAVEATPFKHGEGQPAGKVTVSVGVATFPIHATDPEELLQVADEALYRSKTGGRNRVSLAPAKSSQKTPAA